MSSSSSSSSHSKSSESLHRYKNTQVQFGLIKTIYQIYKTSIGSNLCLIQVSLCDETVINFRCSIKPEDVVVDSRFCSGFGGDLSWGCGYRNLQIIFSSICHSQPQSVLIQRLSNCDDNSNSISISNSISSSINPAVITVPGLVEWQSIIQRAWNDGFDKIGSDHFSGKLVGKRTWIGTTELYVALSYLGIRVRILDFPRPTGPNDTHSKLLDWVIDYFVKPVRLSTHSKPSVAPEIHLSAKPPLYLQHSGHSRTIIGVEISDGHDSNCLLVLDPAKSISRRLRRLTNSVVGRGVSSGVFTSSRSEDSSNPSPPDKLGDGDVVDLQSDLFDLKLLKPHRINLKQLSRFKQYQILYVEDASPLTEREISERKTITSTRIE